jgi:hypothetical protein
MSPSGKHPPAAIRNHAAGNPINPLLIIVHERPGCKRPGAKPTRRAQDPRLFRYFGRVAAVIGNPVLKSSSRGRYPSDSRCRVMPAFSHVTGKSSRHARLPQ